MSGRMATGQRTEHSSAVHGIVRSIARPDASRTYAGRFTAFTDMIYLAFMVLVGCLPLVTGFVAIAAGADLWRERQMRDATVGWRAYASRWRAGARSPGLLAVPTLVVVFVLADLAVAGAPAVPTPMRWAVLAASCLVGGALLLGAGAWRPGLGLREVVRSTVAQVQADPLGPVLAAAAVAIIAVFGWWISPVLFLAPGLAAQSAAGLAARTTPVLPVMATSSVGSSRTD